MRLKKPSPSRRRRALRWAALALTLLLVNAILGRYPLLPSRALSIEASKYALWDTEILHSTWDGTRRIFLCRAEAGLYCAVVSFDPLFGWDIYREPLVVPWDSRPLQGADGSWTDQQTSVYLFGFVPEGEDPPTFSIRTGESLASSHFEPVKEIEQVTPQPEIPGEGGSYYLSIYHYPSSADVGRIYGQDRQGAWSLLRFQRTPVFYWPLNW